MSRSADDPNTAIQKIKPSVGHIENQKNLVQEMKQQLSACFFFARARCLSAGLRSCGSPCGLVGNRTHRQSVSAVKNDALPTEPRGPVLSTCDLNNKKLEL